MEDVYYATAGWRRMRGIPRFGGWFGRKKMSGGGPLIDLGVHMLDLARWLIGSPKAVTVSASTFSFIGQSLALAQKKDFDVEDLASALIRFDNGINPRARGKLGAEFRGARESLPGTQRHQGRVSRVFPTITRTPRFCIFQRGKRRDG